MVWTMTVHYDDGFTQGWIAESKSPDSLFAWLEANQDVFEGKRITLKRITLKRMEKTA